MDRYKECLMRGFFIAIGVIFLLWIITPEAGEYKRAPQVQQYYDKNKIPEIRDEIKRAEKKKCNEERPMYKRLRDRYAGKYKYLTKFFERWETRCGSLDKR